MFFRTTHLFQLSISYYSSSSSCSLSIRRSSSHTLDWYTRSIKTNSIKIMIIKPHITSPSSISSPNNINPLVYVVTRPTPSTSSIYPQPLRLSPHPPFPVLSCPVQIQIQTKSNQNFSFLLLSTFCVHRYLSVSLIHRNTFTSISSLILYLFSEENTLRKSCFPIIFSNLFDSIKMRCPANPHILEPKNILSFLLQ